MLELGLGDGGGRLEDGRAEVLDHVGEQHAEGGEDAGVLGDEDGGDVERVGEGAGVEAAGAAEGEQGEVAGIVAALNADDANGPLHVGVGDADDAFGQEPAAS